MALVAHWVSCLWFMLYRITHGDLNWSYDLLTNAKTMTYYVQVGRQGGAGAGRRQESESM